MHAFCYEIFIRPRYMKFDYAQLFRQIDIASYNVND